MVGERLMISGSVFPSLLPLFSFSVPSEKRSKHLDFYWYRYMFTRAKIDDRRTPLPHPNQQPPPNTELSPPQHSS
jgi:hypothetical protein